MYPVQTTGHVPSLDIMDALNQTNDSLRKVCIPVALVL